VLLKIVYLKRILDKGQLQGKNNFFILKSFSDITISFNYLILKMKETLQ
jgi:hypothetical protein